MSLTSGEVIEVSPTEVIVRSTSGKEKSHKMNRKTGDLVSQEERAKGLLVLPRSMSWQEAVVKEGQQVKKKELLARGITQIFFQANIWVFTVLSLILGAVMGIGKAAVYKHIPDYFPGDVGVVGGIVGVLGGLGGFICPVIFGYLLQVTGLWTSCWMFFAILILVCLTWMHLVIQKMMQTEVPVLQRRIE
jgi:NNP family nitrate/nitrite transporter-like MFS transporter